MRQSGMTLLEVLVVITILALMAAAIPLNSFSALSHVGLRAATQDIASQLRKTRRVAMASGMPRILDLKDISLNDDITLSFTSAQNFDGGFRFAPDGSASGGTIRLTRDDRSFEIRVNWLTGEVTTHDG